MEFCRKNGYKPVKQIEDAMRAREIVYERNGKEYRIFDGYYKMIADFNCYKPVFDERGNMIGEEKAPHEKIQARFADDKQTLDMLFLNEDSMLSNRERSIANSKRYTSEIADKAVTILNEKVKAADLLHEGGESFDNNADSDIFMRSVDTDEQSLRTKPASKKTIKGVKLFRVDKEGRPTALFIDRDKPLEMGKVWYDADCPPFEVIKDLEPGYYYYVEQDNNVTRGREAIRGDSKGQPGVRQIRKAVEEGGRWMKIVPDADGEGVLYYTMGINGSGGVAPYALRPGWHATNVPSARHIGADRNDGVKGKWRRPDERWFEIEMAADVDYNEEARTRYMQAHPKMSKEEIYANLKGDIVDKIPEDGFYNFKTNSNANPKQDWYITGSIRIIRPISEAEAHRMSKEAGVEEDIPYKDGIKNFSEDDVQYSIVGKRGAETLDRAEERTIRMDNLSTAREMESSGKDARAIRLATGWERGADGKWRYEIEDGKITDALIQNRTAVVDGNRVRHIEIHLGEIWDNKALFEAYPELAKIPVSEDFKEGNPYYSPTLDLIALPSKYFIPVFTPEAKQRVDAKFKEYKDASNKFWEKYGDDTTYDDLYEEIVGVKYDEYIAEENRLANNHRNIEGYKLNPDYAVASTLTHEIQHAIQHREGFASGGNKVIAKNYTDKVAADNEYASTRYNNDYKTNLLLKAYKDGNEALMRAFEGNGDVDYEMSLDDVKSSVANTLLRDIEDCDWIPYEEMQKVYELDWKGQMQWVKDNADRISDAIKTSMEQSREGHELWTRYNNMDPYTAYRRLAGEVESRNVQSRMDLTPEQRREQLLADTEDVAREDQIFLMGEGGVAEMGSRVDRRMATIGEHYKDAQLSGNEKSVVDVYSGNSKNATLNIVREDGEHRIIMRQGTEVRGGSKHSLLRHFETGVGYITPEDVALIPKVLEQGVKSVVEKKGKTGYEYQLEINGTKYTVYTEVQSGREAFCDFYSNRKGNNTRSLNTSDEARAVSITASTGSEGSNNNSNSQENSQYSIKKNDAPVFVSNAKRAVEGIKQDKATPEQWLNMLQKNGGLKAGEDKWLGLSDWLKEQGKSVAKQDILDYIAKNEIRIEEVKYGKPVSEEDMKNSESFYELREELEIYDEETDSYRVDEQRFEELKSENDDFRKGFDIDYWGGIEIVDANAAARYLDLSQSERLAENIRLDYSTKGLDNYREIALTVPTIDPYKKSDTTHFGDAGEGRAVAWIRFGETTDADGNRVLVIDEIQSKRHQDGREKGYREKNAISYKEAWDVWKKYLGELEDKYKKQYKENYDDEDLQYYMTKDESEKLEALGNQMRQARSAESGGIYSDSKVPDAPFDKNWHELAMKRMLRLAAEEGFDKIAWTTGDQQADRYDIGTTVQAIDVENVSAKNREVWITNMSGDPVMLVVDSEGNVVNGNGIVPHNSKVSEVFGKELGQKIMEAKEEDTFIPEDLHGIGRGGMTGFYDKMLPSFMNKYGKKWGVKVGTVEMPGLEENNVMHSVDVTPEMREGVMEGQVQFSIKGGSAKERKLLEKVDELKEQVRGLKNDVRQDLKDGKFNFAVDRDDIRNIADGVRRFISEQFSPETAKEMNKTELQSVMKQLATAITDSKGDVENVLDRKKVRDAMTQIERVATHVEARRMTKQFHKVLTRPIRSVNSKGVAQARGVDNQTRVVLDYARSL